MRILPRPCAGVPLHAPDHSALSVEDFWPSDRIDIHIDVPAVNYKGMRSASDPESSATIRERVVRARDLQLMRFASASRDKLCCNAQMGRDLLGAFASCRRIASDCWSAPGGSRADGAGARPSSKWQGRLRILTVVQQSNLSILPRLFNTEPWIGRSGLNGLW